jgi:hypothetical protein
MTHHAEGLVNPKVRAKKRLLILDTPEHVDSEIKLKIGSQPLIHQLFLNGIFNHKMWLKLAKIGKN